MDVELCHSIVHSGRLVVKKSIKCRWAAVDPGVPGTRGMRRGARREEGFGLMEKAFEVGGRVAERRCREEGERGV